MLLPLFILILNLSLLMRFIRGDTVFNVLLLSGELHLFRIVTDNIAHGVHHSLDAFATGGDLCLSSSFLLYSDTHVVFKLISVGLLAFLDLSHTLLLLLHVILDNLHCSLAFLNFTQILLFLFHRKVIDQLSLSCLLVISEPLLFVDLLLFGLFKHLVSHDLLFNNFAMKCSFLFTFNIEFSLGFIEQLLVEIFTLFLVLFTKLSSQFYLLVKHFSDLLTLVLVISLLLLNLLFIETLPEFLDLTPLIITDVARQVFDLSLNYITVLDCTFLLLNLKLCGPVGWNRTLAFH